MNSNEQIRIFSQKFLPLLANRPFDELVIIGFLIHKPQANACFIDYLKTAAELLSQPINLSDDDKKVIASLSIDEKVFLAAKSLLGISADICRQNKNIDPEVGFRVAAGLLVHKTVIEKNMPANKISETTIKALQSLFEDIAKAKQMKVHQELITLNFLKVGQKVN